ncbi:CPK25, partial [Symbiodinium microadriaticum]
MLHGVHYLHSLGIIHRDLKVENILLHKVGDHLEVKIADFGLSAICELGAAGYDAEHSVKRKRYSACRELWGTKEYFAPELIRRAYGPQVDMWSLGCIAYEMLAGCPAFSL